MPLRANHDVVTPDSNAMRSTGEGAVHSEQAPAREVYREPSMTAQQRTLPDHRGSSYVTRPEGASSSPRYTFSEASGFRPSGAIGAPPATPHALLRPSMMIEATSEPIDAGVSINAKQYNGRYRRWPGILLLLVTVVGGAVAITFAGLRTHSRSVTRQEAYAKRQAGASAITGGADGSLDDLVSDDGAIGNPKVYPDMGCELPDYQSKNGRIYAVASNGTKVAVDFKGINWFGMETGTAIPLGLWDNSQNGTTAYQIAAFLATNKFNAVRLPLCIDSILTNKVPLSSLINVAANRAISVKNYLSLLKSLIKALGYRRIGVLLSLHTLTATDSGGLWYSKDISKNEYLSAVDTLTSELCDNTYWNIIGLDLKNEPYKSTWGDGKDTDWRLGAQTIGNRMLKGCSNWMGFVEGIYSFQTLVINGTKFQYFDWYGSGLENASAYPVKFTIENKVVYAPHYYTPAVYPQSYLFDGGTPDENGALMDYVELSTATLKLRIEATMEAMFGYLSQKTSAALVLGEFGGLYAKDLHPKRSTQRCTDISIEIMVEKSWAGGFVWSLNPESAYQFNPADKYGHFTEGVLEDDWLTADQKFLDGLEAMDKLEHLRMMPCFETKVSSSD
ncbi:hypothetical protein PsorP6_002847 [Peronosclerospora sorghi]|uniref:Uncharacterized protein n=1 Tax=Peronosclerospora sorghi TaxID=230839 RepID=A0ACC0VKL4_9STRA|nr:hypothetical protein PsorP6_002847 [Peronosclerospora sorghi]